MIIMQGNVPQLCMNIVPPDEREDMCLLNLALRGLDKYTKQFCVAAHLFDYCSMQDSVSPAPQGATSPFRSWRLLACREAFMSLLNFREEMEAAKTLAENSAYVGGGVDESFFEKAQSRFAECFPDFERIRHASVRASGSDKAFEIGASDQGRIAPGLLFKNGKAVILQESLEDRTFACAYQGRHVHCEVSAGTIEKMHQIMQLFFGGFAGLTQSRLPPASTA